MAIQVKNAKEIFVEAIEQYTPSQWPEFLNEACGNDAPLRKRVEILLKAHIGDESLLDRPAIAPAQTVEYSTERLGTTVGPYKLLEQIGEGGMGVVYMAEQQRPVRRLVALKIIKPGMDSRQIIARFEAERQALAMMEHPNIARILDGGTVGRDEGGRMKNEEAPSSFIPPPSSLASGGRPYFVMELVRGIPLNEFCEQKRLPVHERLELFIQVCQAVQHAHQKGIIHRDLKPTNVLVTMHDSVAVPKVIDFGIAKALGQSLTEHTLHTGFTQMVGTPLYMSPEQAEINAFGVDTRSDVYSLGVMLYELLTGTTPFDKERLTKVSFDEMRRIIREEEPETVSTRLAKTRSRHTPCSVNQIDGTRSVPTTYRAPSAQPRAPRLSELDWIVAQSLEKDRVRRYESASALAADIQRYLADEPVQACPPSVSYRFRKFAAKHKVVLTTTSAIAASLLICTVVSAWQAVEANTARQVATERLTSEQKARREAELQYQRAERERQRAESERLRAESERQRAESERDRAESHARKVEEHRQSLENYQRVNALVAKEVVGVVETASTSGAKRHATLLQLLSRLNDLDIDPSERVTAYHSIGNQFVTLKEYEGALAAYREGLALDPHHAGIFISRGDLHYRQAQWDKAADDYTTAIKDLRDSDPVIRSVPLARRGHVRAKQGRIDEAMADFWASYAAFPQQTMNLLSHIFLTNPGSLLRFPKLNSGSDQLQPLLLSLLDRYVADQKQSANALGLRADVLGYLGQWDRAHRDYEAAIEKGVASWEPYASLATLALKRGDSADYRQICQAMLAKSVAVNNDEFKLVTAFICGNAPSELDDYESVISIARAALARQPQRGFCFLTLGLLLLRDGQFEEARQQLEFAAKSRGDSAQVHAPILLAITFYRMGQTDQAREQLKQAIARRRPPLIGSSWRLQLLMDVLQREAEQLINAPIADNKP